MHLAKKATGNWSNLALFGSFLIGMMFHRNASASKNFISQSLRQFEKFETKNNVDFKCFNKRTKLNNGKAAATKVKADKEEFDVNILFMN